MSTLWTPDGERPIRRDSAQPSQNPGHPRNPGTENPENPGNNPYRDTGGYGDPVGYGEEAGYGDQSSHEELEAQMDELRAQLADTPPEVVVANHCFGLFELAALHLSQRPPNLPAAQLAIDAFGALVENLGGRLGDPEPQLKEGLSQLRVAFVQLRKQAQSDN